MFAHRAPQTTIHKIQRQFLAHREYKICRHFQKTQHTKNIEFQALYGDTNLLYTSILIYNYDLRDILVI